VIEGHVTVVISPSKNLVAFEEHVIPLLKANGVSYSFQSCYDPLPAAGVILCMGTKAFDVFRVLNTDLQPFAADDGNHGVQLVKPKTMSITTARDHILGDRIFVTFDPNLIEMDPAREPDILWDVQKVCRFVNTGSIKPPLGTYKFADPLVLSYDIAAIAHDAESLGAPFPVSIDLETMGLSAFVPDARILTVSFTFTHGVSTVYKVPSSGMPEEYMLEALVRLTNQKHFKLLGANLKFDIIWMYQKWGILFENQVFDSYLVGGLLNENMSNSLNTHAKLHTQIGGYDDPFNLKWDKAHMEVPLETAPDEFVTYAGGDTDAVFRLYPIFKHKLLDDKRLTRFYLNVMQPAAKVFAKMEHHGVCIDRDQYKVVEDIIDKDIVAYRAQLLDMIPRRIHIKHTEKNGQVKLKPAVITDYLFTSAGLDLEPLMTTNEENPDAKPSTNKNHLKMFADHPVAGPFVTLLREHNQAIKSKTTYVTGFMKFIQPDGKWHPTYSLARADYGRDKDEGTVTGRTSSWYQTLPKHTKYAGLLRTVIVCPPGHVGICIDFSQGELRIFATLANEKNMIAAYVKGIDLHMITGADAAGLTFEQAMSLPEADRKKVRQGGKAGNFGLIYRISPDGFVEYARNTYGVIMTVAEAAHFQEKFFARWPAVDTYHKSQVSSAKEYGQVRSPLGRIRHLPAIKSHNSQLRGNAERQAINSPTQATLSDFGLMAMAEMDRRHPEVWFFGFVHDDLQMYVPEDKWESYAKELQDIMQNLPLRKVFGFELPLPMVGDIAMFSTNLAESHEIKEIA